VRASGALCRAADSSARAPTRASEHPVGWPLCNAAALAGTCDAEDLRRARSAVTAAGLERRTTTDQCAFHRIDPNLAARAGSATLVVHVRSFAPHPVACRDPCLPRQGHAVRFRLSRMLPTLPCGLAVRHEKDASHRLLQPTAPNEHPADCSIPGCVLALPRLAPGTCEIAGSSWAKGLTKPGLGTRLRLPDQPPSGASLDGEPPASASVATRILQRDGRAPEVGAPRAAHVKIVRPRAVLVEHRSIAPLRRASRSGRSQPRTEHAT